MPKVIRTLIDERGNVSSDFSGFVNGECEVEEARLRQELEQFGLTLRVELKRRKPDTVNVQTALLPVSPGQSVP